MLRAPSATFGAVGWICFTLIWLGSTVLVCQTVLTAVKLWIRFLQQRAAEARVVDLAARRRPLSPAPAGRDSRQAVAR